MLTTEDSRSTSPRNLLLALCRRRTSDDHVRVDLRGVDVDAFLELVDYHRVGPLLHDLLDPADRAPVELVDALAAVCVRARAMDLRVQWVLQRLNETLEMPFLVVKGPVLTAQFYGPGELRDFGDLDVLVHPDDFGRAFADLQRSGYRCAATNWHGFLQHAVAEVPVALGPTTLDLHWDLVALGRTRRHIRMGARPLFDHSVDVTVGAATVHTLDPADTLVHLGVHTGLDGGRRLRGLIDLFQVVASGRVDPEAFARRATSFGAADLCAVSLQRCANVLDTKAADRYLAALSPSKSWLYLNHLTDRIGLRTRGERPAVAPGSLVAATRTGLPSTLQAWANSLSGDRERVAGRRARASTHDELDWRRMPPDGDVERHRRDYLAFVAGRHEAIRRVRCRDGTTLSDRVGQFQPRSSALLGAALLDESPGAPTRIDLFEFEDGNLAAAVVRFGWRPLGVTAFPLLLDPRAAPVVASILDASSATDLSGFEVDTEPLRGHMSRWRSRSTATPASLPPGFLWEEAPEDVRSATRADLDALVDAVWRYSPHAFPNRGTLRRRLRRAIDRTVLVAEVGSPRQAAGFAILESSTPEYDIWGQVVVIPEHRDRGLSWHLVAAGAARAAQRGVGGLVMVVDSNPMSIPVDAASADVWTYVSLSPPRRFRGEARLRRWADELLALPARFDRRPQTASAGVGNEAPRAGSKSRFTTRRTQQSWRGDG